MSAVAELQAVLSVGGLGAWRAGMQDAGGAVDALQARMDRLNRAAMVAGAGAGAIGAGLYKAIRAAGQMQGVETGFRTLLGSAEAARAKIQEVSDFAATSPFNFEEVAQSAQMLMGFGASADQVIPIMEALGNAISSSGRGTQEYGRAILAVSQIISMGKLQGMELLQLAQAGVPLKELLAELGTSMGEVGKKGITAEQTIDALIKVMGQGRFAGAMVNQNKTLFGSMSNLEDATFRLADAIGKPLVGPITTVTRTLSDLVTMVNSLSPSFKTAVAVGGAVLFGMLTVLSVAAKAAAIHTTFLARRHLQAAEAARKQALNERMLTDELARQAVVARGGGVGGAVLPVPTSGGGRSRLGRLAKGGGVAMAATIAAELALGFMPDEGGMGVAKRLGQGAARGAAAGALAGSIVPGLGTAAGAGIGAALGGAYSAYGEFTRSKDAEKPTPAASTDKQILDELKKQTGALEKMGRTPIGTQYVPGAWQGLALRLSKELA